MSVYFQCLDIELVGAEIEHRANYGGRFDHLHLKSNSAHKLPFAILVPAGFGLNDLDGAATVANFKRHTGRMEAVGGVDFENYQLIVRIADEQRPLPERRGVVVIERLYHDVLPLADFPSGFIMPDEPGLPTANDPILASSHTKDGGGWYAYKIYVEEV